MRTQPYHSSCLLCLAWPGHESHFSQSYQHSRLTFAPPGSEVVLIHAVLYTKLLARQNKVKLPPSSASSASFLFSAHHFRSLHFQLLQPDLHDFDSPLCGFYQMTLRPVRRTWMPELHAVHVDKWICVWSHCSLILYFLSGCCMPNRSADLGLL